MVFLHTQIWFSSVVSVQSGQQVRITDFGLAKLLDYNEEEYRSTGGKVRHPPTNQDRYLLYVPRLGAGSFHTPCRVSSHPGKPGILGLILAQGLSQKLEFSPKVGASKLSDSCKSSKSGTKRQTQIPLEKIVREFYIVVLPLQMPIKWLALECIQHRIFTHKSDVWSYG